MKIERINTLTRQTARLPIVRRRRQRADGEINQAHSAHHSCGLTGPARGAQHDYFGCHWCSCDADVNICYFVEAVGCQLRRGGLQGLQDRGEDLRRLLSAVPDGKNGHAFADCATVDMYPNSNYRNEAGDVC